MKTKQLPTYKVEIYTGLQEGYSGKSHKIKELHSICRKYCDMIGLGLTVTKTKFIYTGGSEKGAVIGLINTPRFPKNNIDIQNHAINLAEIIKAQFNQERIFIVCTDVTIMIE